MRSRITSAWMRRACARPRESAAYGDSLLRYGSANAGSGSLLDAIARNLATGVTWIQIREKDLSARALFELVEAALKLPNPHRSKIIVNTRADVALAAGVAGAAGVHLPSGSPRSATLAAIGRWLPGRRVVSLRGGRAQAEAEGADYVVFGPVFPPRSKTARAGAARAGGFAARGSGGADSGARTGWSDARELRRVCFRRRGGRRGNTHVSRVGKIRLVTAAAAKQAYSRAETRRLLKISERQLKSWEHQKLLPATETYGFKELLALKTLVNLRAARVASPQIKRALTALREKLRHIHDPLTQLKIYADGKRIRVEIDGRAMEAESGQLLLNFDAVELKRLLEFRKPEPLNTEQVQRAAAEHWFQRGLELEQTGAPLPEIIEAYQKAVELDPTSAGALVNLGTIQFNARNWKEAERYYLEALKADPQYALAHFDLANLYDERGDRVQASGTLSGRARNFAHLRRRALQPRAALSGIEPDDEGRAALDRISEAGSFQPLVEHRAAGAVEAAQGGRRHRRDQQGDHRPCRNGLRCFLAPDGGVRPVARNHDRRLRKRQQLLVNRAENLAAIAARQIRSPDAVAEQRVARDQLVLGRNPDARCCPGCAPACGGCGTRRHRGVAGRPRALRYRSRSAMGSACPARRPGYPGGRRARRRSGSCTRARR